jgi:hypothetical protein
VIAGGGGGQDDGLAAVENALADAVAVLDVAQGFAPAADGGGGGGYRRR